MKSVKIVAQGDLLFVPVSRIPDKANRRSAEAGRYVLALGEATGHNHTITAERVEVYDAAEAVFIKIMDAPAEVVHQEHAPTVLEPGTWQMRPQVSYQPGELPRRVVD